MKKKELLRCGGAREGCGGAVPICPSPLGRDGPGDASTARSDPLSSLKPRWAALLFCLDPETPEDLASGLGLCAHAGKGSDNREKRDNTVSPIINLSLLSSKGVTGHLSDSRLTAAP